MLNEVEQYRSQPIRGELGLRDFKDAVYILGNGLPLSARTHCRSGHCRPGGQTAHGASVDGACGH